VNTTVTATPGPLDRELTALGFRPGAPAHVHPATLSADVRSYRGARCGSCNRRRQSVHPWHRRGEYRLVLTCRGCGHQAEA
jgi:hypothetical protein